MLLMKAMAKKRRRNELRPVRIEKQATAAPGAVMITQGQTRVLCTASVSTDLPPWLAGRDGQPATRGWVTAEYAMLPGSTSKRKRRGPDSRGTEIQRMIARSLRAAVDLSKMPGLLITCDCDVVLADGGTRTAAITGAFVALSQALSWAHQQNLVTKRPIVGPVAAVSVGIVDGQVHLDLDYELDVRAEVDMNVVSDHKANFIEIQGTAERRAFDRAQLDELLDLAQRGIRKLIRLQRQALG